MNTLSSGKKAVLHFYRLFFGVALLLLPLSIFATFWLSSAQSVSRQLEHSKAYDVASEVVVEQLVRVGSASAQAQQLPSGAVERAARAVITPDVVGKKVETFITQNYEWLDNKRTEPVLEISIQKERDQFARELVKEATKTVEEKPACDVMQVMQYQAQLRADPLSVPCKIDGIDRAEIEGVATQKITEAFNNPTSQQKDTSITSGALTVTPSESQTYIDALSGIAKLAYWCVKHGFMMVISILLIAGALAFATLRSGTDWLIWARAAFASAALTLFVGVVMLILSTQTTILPLFFVTETIQPVIAALARPLIVAIAVTIVVYLIVMLFGILARARKRREYDSNRDAYAASRNDAAYQQLRTSGRSSGKPF